MTLACQAILVTAATLSTFMANVKVRSMDAITTNNTYLFAENSPELKSLTDSLEPSTRRQSLQRVEVRFRKETNVDEAIAQVMDVMNEKFHEANISSVDDSKIEVTVSNFFEKVMPNSNGVERRHKSEEVAMWYYADMKNRMVIRSIPKSPWSKPALALMSFSGDRVEALIITQTR